MSKFCRYNTKNRELAQQRALLLEPPLLLSFRPPRHRPARQPHCMPDADALRVATPLSQLKKQGGRVTEGMPYDGTGPAAASSQHPTKCFYPARKTANGAVCAMRFGKGPLLAQSSPRLTSSGGMSRWTLKSSAEEKKLAVDNAALIFLFKKGD